MELEFIWDLNQEEKEELRKARKHFQGAVDCILYKAHTRWVAEMIQMFRDDESESAWHNDLNGFLRWLGSE